MERLQKYNQKILAILGTMTIAGLGFILLAGCYTFINSVLRNERYDQTDSSVRIGLKPDSAQQMATRDQSISFGFPHLIDTLKAIYLIPVGQVNLVDPEPVDEEDLSFLKKGRHKYEDKENTSSYNNLVIYDQRSGLKAVVFSQRVGITEYENLLVGGKNYIFVTAASRDTNKDGKLNHRDLKSFYLYCVENKKLDKVEVDDMSFLVFSLLFNSKEVVLRFGVDKNKDGEYDFTSEPAVLKSFSIDSLKADDFIESGMSKEIQTLMD